MQRGTNKDKIMNDDQFPHYGCVDNLSQLEECKRGWSDIQRLLASREKVRGVWEYHHFEIIMNSLK